DREVRADDRGDARIRGGGVSAEAGADAGDATGLRGRVRLDRTNFRHIFWQQFHLLSVLTMSDGRRAAVWWTVLLAVIIAGDHLLALALHQVLMRSQFRYSRLYRGGNDADVVIIGDSRGVHSFYAPALQQMIGLRVMNLSYNSLSPHVAEAVLLDYLDHNRAPRIVVIEATSAITSGAVASQLRTYAGLSPRMAALYARDHPFEARASRLFWLFPLNSEFFLEALHSMRRSD